MAKPLSDDLRTLETYLPTIDAKRYNDIASQLFAKCTDSFKNGLNIFEHG